MTLHSCFQPASLTPHPAPLQMCCWSSLITDSQRLPYTHQYKTVGTSTDPTNLRKKITSYFCHNGNSKAIFRQKCLWVWAYRNEYISYNCKCLVNSHWKQQNVIADYSLNFPLTVKMDYSKILLFSRSYYCQTWPWSKLVWMDEAQWMHHHTHINICPGQTQTDYILIFLTAKKHTKTT